LIKVETEKPHTIKEKTTKMISVYIILKQDIYYFSLRFNTVKKKTIVWIRDKLALGK
jgi:hypothetical protein